MSQPIPTNNQLDYDPMPLNFENNGHDLDCYGPDEHNECDCGLSQAQENEEQLQPM